MSQRIQSIPGPIPSPLTSPSQHLGVSCYSLFFPRSFRTKGRDMVEYLEHGLLFHIAHELKHRGHESHDQKNNENDDHDDEATILERLERAFLMADIHSNQLGITTSGATVAVCLVQVSERKEGRKIHTQVKGTGEMPCFTSIVSSPQSNPPTAALF